MLLSVKHAVRLGGRTTSATAAATAFVWLLLIHINIALCNGSKLGGPRGGNIRHREGDLHQQQVQRRVLKKGRRGGNRKQKNNQPKTAETYWSGEDIPDTSINNFYSSDNNEDDGDDDEDDTVFTPAQPLSFFKNGIDPEIFQWVNKEEIAPGATTCGFLHAPLGSVVGQVYPIVEVYICMKFATSQPAKKGNLFQHAGGPSSLSGEGVEMTNEKFTEDYNIIGIDQRGMGRSEPSFFHEECLVPGDQFLTGPVDFTNGTSIEEFLEAIKSRAVSCWTCEDCNFHLEATQEEGTITPYHFLEYSGTLQLAEDIERFRQVISAPKLSLYGISYGTQVVAEYATLFPEHVDKFVADSCMPPTNDLFKFAKEAASGANSRINYLVYSCEAQNMVNPGSCPVEDLGACINDINDLSLSGVTFDSILNLLLNSTDNTQELCDAAGAGDADSFLAALGEASSSRMRRVQETPEIDCSSAISQPSYSDSAYPCGVYGKPNYYEIKEASAEYTAPFDFEQYPVIAQDYFGGTFNTKEFIRDTLAMNDMYEGYGSGFPAGQFGGIYAVGFYWPRNTPLTVRGNPTIEGIISGQQYDLQTPYTWTQQMRQNFMSTSLLTVQFVNHGLDSVFNEPPYPDCEGLVDDYIMTGDITFNDGYVCSARFPSVSNILYAWNNWAIPDFLDLSP